MPERTTRVRMIVASVDPRLIKVFACAYALFVALASLFEIEFWPLSVIAIIAFWFSSGKIANARLKATFAFAFAGNLAVGLAIGNLTWIRSSSAALGIAVAMAVLWSFSLLVAIWRENEVA